MPVTLAHLDYPAAGAETEPPLLIAHGLFGQGRNFHTLARRLAGTRQVVALDMRNHGASPWDPVMSYEAMAEDLADAIERHCGGRASVLGHSMGGKAAMTLALSEPGLVAALVVADIAPVAYAHSHLGYVRAMRALDLGRVTRRSDADPLLADAVPDAGLRAFILQGLELKQGVAKWRLNLAALEANMETILSFPADLPESAYEGPAFFLHGAASDYVAPETQPRIRALFPEAEIEAIDGAGHWLHAEKPEEFVSRVDEWLRSV
ncbi:alpha/beta fold hydrolase [Limibaculum sp. M0105]|uniref:Alpha/beta fold hydrolase n=1 Tax=Thermohalobaculum xanthum TaxID=2753746 RepID=A0A8J7SHP8_9RHOB|nr:alpha/beta fold hydrolase [Thermohalobaculum xanthum]MBK0399845.1 alpha/beta fold hydrolase [Thermohalobaculum xanthum]